MSTPEPFYLWDDETYVVGPFPSYQAANDHYQAVKLLVEEVGAEAAFEIKQGLAFLQEEDVECTEDEIIKPEDDLETARKYAADMAELKEEWSAASCG